VAADNRSVPRSDAPILVASVFDRRTYIGRDRVRRRHGRRLDDRLVVDLHAGIL
jgi:hypothetical protein